MGQFRCLPTVGRVTLRHVSLASSHLAAPCVPGECVYDSPRTTSTNWSSSRHQDPTTGCHLPTTFIKQWVGGCVVRTFRGSPACPWSTGSLTYYVTNNVSLPLRRLQQHQQRTTLPTQHQHKPNNNNNHNTTTTKQQQTTSGSNNTTAAAQEASATGTAAAPAFSLATAACQLQQASASKSKH